MSVKTQAGPSSVSTTSREGGHVLEMQRRRLLLAHSEVLAERGLQGASVDRICKHAGVSRRTFYDLFLDREGCFLAALELARERITTVLIAGYAANTGPARSPHSWRARMRTGLTILLELFDSEPALAHMCIVETLKGGPEVLAWRQNTLEKLVEAIAEGDTKNNSDTKNKDPTESKGRTKNKAHTESKGRAKNEDSAENEGLTEGKLVGVSLTAEGVVGGVLSVIHTRLIEHTTEPLLGLLNPLMSMIVHPYLGPAAAVRELKHTPPTTIPTHNGHAPTHVQDPFKDLPIRITFRTARVLTEINAQPGASNRTIGDAAGIPDQGQISKLLRRLANNGLITNHGQGHTEGEPNAWTLTTRGEAIQHTINPPQT